MTLLLLTFAGTCGFRLVRREGHLSLWAGVRSPLIKSFLADRSVGDEVVGLQTGNRNGEGGALGGQVSQAQASGLLGEDFEGVSIRDRSVGLTLIGG